MTGGQTGLGVFNRGTMGSVRERDGSFSVPLAFAARLEAVDLLGRNAIPVTSPLAFHPWQIRTVQLELVR